MKRTLIAITILTLVGMLVATTQVFASPAPGALPDPNKTPGAQATARAVEKATQGIGSGGGSAQGKKENFKGTIASADSAALGITLADGTTMLFVLTPETSIHIPTLGNATTASDLRVGMQVQVQASVDEAGMWIARRVTAIPGKPTLTHRVGTVSTYVPGESITILAQDQEFTFLLADDVKILPEERLASLVIGARVTIIAPRDVAGGTSTAAGIVIHPAATP